MAGGSVRTSIQGRDARRDELDLGMRDGAILFREIEHLRTRHVLVRSEVEEAARLVGHQGERATNVGHRAADEIGLFQAGLSP